MDREYLGDFKILKRVGGGPLGPLYLGEHRFIKRRFAIKVLPEELSADSTFIERFENQVGLIATLEHMNIAKVHNVSSSEGIYYIVSDFISDGYGEGKNFSQYLGGVEKRLGEKDVLSILRQVAYALDYIHSKKFDGKALAHGSLKLNNIVVGKIEDGVPHVYLTDIGLNTIVGQGRILTKTYAMVAETLDIDMRLTGVENERIYSSQNPEKVKLSKLHRSFLQSYAFLAPEQKLGGNPERISPKADVYAFGVLAYFLLMGHLPDGFFSMPSKGSYELKYNWDILVQACMRQNPDERPDSLVAALERIQAKELANVEETIEKVAKPKLQPREAPPKEDEYKPKVEVKKTPGMYDLKGRNTSIEEMLTKTNSTTRVTTIKKPEPQRAVVVELVEEDKGDLALLTEAKPIIRESELKKLQYEEDPGAIFQKDTTVAPYKPKEKEVVNLDPILTEMVLVAGGEYVRGSDIGARDEKPKHKVRIENFALDTHPVTNEQFLRFLEVMGCEKDANNNDMILLKDSRINRSGGRLSIETGYAKHPVVGVSWYGAQAYAKWVGKRLPTEAEWEIAAKAGKETNVYPFGASIERSEANFFSSDTTAVMSYPPNDWGLYDMAGNVYEWCEDWYAYNYYETSLHEPINPTGPVQGVYRVLRGGCWKSLEEDLRCSHRHRNNPGTMNRTYGFRLAADVES